VKHSSHHIAFVLATGVLAGYSAALPAGAAAGDGERVCTRYGEGDVTYQPHNIVLFVLDDVSWAELPALNLPIKWPDDDSPPTSGAVLSEAVLRRPDLNRLAARVYAASDGEDCGVGPAGTSDPAVSADSACLGAADGNPVVPVDLQSGTPQASGAADFRYETGIGADDVHHILEGHGGLSLLAREGVAFSRYYATSAKCAPTRASIITGRYPHQISVPRNRMELPDQQITIADYLKSMCEDPEEGDTPSNTPCYATSFVGKWGLGRRPGPWERGFDEAFYYASDHRKHWAQTKLECAPVEQFYCTPSLSSGAECNDSTPCATGEVCSTTPHPGWDGYCYEAQPTTTCDPNGSWCSGDLCDPSGTSCSAGLQCLPWSAYLGPMPQLACHPEDSGSPSCCKAKSTRNAIRSDIYDFSEKRLASGAKFWQVDRGTSRPCDENAGPTTETRCSYDTRYYRDVAKNFILRHAHDSTAEADNRFFLYFAPHALHHRSDAPLKTQEHYATAGLEPELPSKAQAGRKFWGALEEMDAAVGEILNVINGYCDGDPVGLGINYGVSCSSNDDCIANATCNTTLKQNTLVLFTADQGRPSEGYGEPGLRGGKGSVYEGGIRVGLLAWGPGLGVDPGRFLETPIGSQVDLFATIAHAAGCKPDVVGDGEARYQVKVCNDGSRKFCSDGGDCPGGVCQTRLLAGHTLLPDLSPDIAGSTSIEPRRFAFAHWGGAKTVVAHPDEFGVRVCGRKIEEPRSQQQGWIERVRRLHSCSTCTTNSDCDSEKCRSDGSFCVPDADKTYCEQGNSNCDPKRYARCGPTAACGSGESCTQLLAPCVSENDGCTKPAVWKLRGSGGDGNADVTVSALFDLATNPEEVDTVDPQEPGASVLSNCAVANPTQQDVEDETKLASVQDQLQQRLNGWFDCVTGGGSNTDCDAEMHH